MRKYEQPDVNVVVFGSEDVIKTSTGIPNVGGGNNYTPGGTYRDGDDAWL